MNQGEVRIIRIDVSKIRCSCKTGWPMIIRPFGGVALLHADDCLITRYVREQGDE